MNSLLTLILGILAIRAFNNKSLALISVTVLVQSVICMVMYIMMYRKGKKLYSKEYWGWSLSLAIPLIPHYLSEVLLGHSDRIMINKMCGPAQSGIYNIVYQISMLMTIIRTGINGAFAPWLYSSIKVKKYADIKRITSFLAIMMATLSLIFMLIGPELLKIAAPKSYYEAVVDIPSIMIGCFFMFVYILFVYVEIYYEEKRYVATASIIAALTNIVLNTIFIKLYGYLVAGYTTMFSYLLMTIIHYAFLRKITEKHNEIDYMFNKKLLLFICFFMISIIIPMILLYRFWVLRYCIIIIVMIIMIIKRKLIMSFFTQLKNKSANEEDFV